MSSSQPSGSPPRFRPLFRLRYRGMGGASGAVVAERVELVREPRAGESEGASASYALLCTTSGQQRLVRLGDLMGIEVVLLPGPARSPSAAEVL